MKKKLLSFVLVCALMLTGTICLAGCGADHIDFDMFEKTYTIGSNMVGSFLYDGESEDNRQVLSNWEQWLKDNESRLTEDDFSGESASKKPINAENLIAELKSYNYISNATINVTSLEPSGALRKGKVNISGGGLNSVQFDFEAPDSTTYPGTYTYGNLKPVGNSEDNAGMITLIVSWNAKVKSMNIYYNDYKNYNTKTLYLNGRQLELRVGYDLLNVSPIA